MRSHGQASPFRAPALLGDRSPRVAATRQPWAMKENLFEVVPIQVGSALHRRSWIPGWNQVPLLGASRSTVYAPHMPRCRESAVQRADTKVRTPAALVVVPRGPGLLVGYRSDGSAHCGSPIPEGSQKLAGGRAKRHPRSPAPKRCRHPGGVRDSVAKQHGAVRVQPIWGGMPPLPVWVIGHKPSGRIRRSTLPRCWFLKGAAGATRCRKQTRKSS